MRSTIVLPVLLGFVVFWGVFAGVLNRGRDYVSATCPLAQINYAAPLTAEGELVVGLPDLLLADGATNLDGTLSGHGAQL